MKRHTRKGYFFNFLDRINDLTMKLKIIVHGQTTYPHIYILNRAVEQSLDSFIIKFEPIKEK